MRSSDKVRLLLVLCLILVVAGNTAGLMLSPAGVVLQLTGRLSVQRGPGVLAGRAGQALFAGDRLATGPATSVTIGLGNHRIRMGPEASLLITRADAARCSYSLFLWLGRLWLCVQKGLKAVDFTVETPAAMAGVRGTLFSVSVAPDGTTWVGVAEGEVAVSTRGAAEAVTLTPGYATSVRPGGAPAKPAKVKPGQVGGEDLKKKEKQKNDKGKPGNGSCGNGEKKGGP